MTNCLLWDAAKAKPGLKREGGCRRDGSSPQVDATRAPTIGSTGYEATGLAPPSMIAKGTGSVSVRKRRDCSPEIAPEPTGHGLPLSKCEAYNRVYEQPYGSS
jgi:hypothetical protein